MFCSIFLSNKVIQASSFYHYRIDEWFKYVAYRYLVYEDFCRGVGQFNWPLINKYIR